NCGSSAAGTFNSGPTQLLHHLSSPYRRAVVSFQSTFGGPTVFNPLFTSPRAVERYSSGPLLEERLRYLAHCAAQGSTRSTLRLIAQHQLALIDYLHLQTADAVTVEQIHAATDLWVHRQPQPHSHNVTDYRYGRMRFISNAKQWLGFLGRLRPAEVPRRPYAHLI